METKMVKFEIGKVLAIVITVVVVAMLAAVFMQSSYFQGNIGGVDCDIWENSVYVPCLEAVESEPATINQDITDNAVESEPATINQDITDNAVESEPATINQDITENKTMEPEPASINQDITESSTMDKEENATLDPNKIPEEEKTTSDSK